MWVKVHQAYRIVVAVCDSDLLGKNFEEGKFQLDVKPSFYQGDELGEEQLIPLLKSYLQEDATFTIVGKKSIDVGIKTGILEKKGVRYIQGIPFAMILL